MPHSNQTKAYKEYILELLLSGHSRLLADQIVTETQNNPERVAVLIDFLMSGEYLIVQRVSWPLSIIAEKTPEALTPFLDQLIPLLAHSTHHAAHRNILRLLQFINIPKKHQGNITDACFRFLYDAQTPVAIKSFSMEIVHRIAREEPDLATELCLYIEDRMDFESPGFRSRGRKILMYWQKKKH